MSPWKLLELIPDKNGTVIFGAKEDPEGHFVSREKALEYMQIKDAEVKAARERVLSCVLGDITDLTKEVSWGYHTNQGVFEQLMRITCRIESLRSSQQPENRQQEPDPTLGSIP